MHGCIAEQNYIFAGPFCKQYCHTEHAMSPANINKQRWHAIISHPTLSFHPPYVHKTLRLGLPLERNALHPLGFFSILKKFYLNLSACGNTMTNREHWDANVGLNSTVLIVQSNKEQMDEQSACLCEADSWLRSWKLSWEIVIMWWSRMFLRVWCL